MTSSIKMCGALTYGTMGVMAVTPAPNAGKKLHEYKINWKEDHDKHTAPAAEMRDAGNFVDFVNEEGLTVFRIRADLVKTVEMDPRVVITPSSDGLEIIQ
ncbi:hypothetical protein COUCH_34165 [Couchioplanes caeruleus]|uniref:hypothetical protein n=1 Tax=Couchioplanes caeruleus TaxID=56438 RepID=UPI0020C184FE|nr:hypothetical protein [Couchioplanes caeruleus]UQU63969.1 hypothetical protein COUCH_34165 [Couchioplanes caeruleus]